MSDTNPRKTQHVKLDINNIHCSMAIRPYVIALYIGTDPSTGNMPMGEPCAIFYSKSKSPAYEVRELNDKWSYPIYEKNTEVTELVQKDLSPEEIFQYSLMYKYFPELVIAMKIVKNTVLEREKQQINYINKWIHDNENHKS